MDHRSSPEWRYKQRASRQVPGAFQMAIDPAAPDQVSFVFIAPSKARSHPLCDDRLTRMLGTIRRDPPLEIPELIFQIERTEAVRSLEVRPRNGRTVHDPLGEDSLLPPGNILVLAVVTSWLGRDEAGCLRYNKRPA